MKWLLVGGIVVGCALFVGICTIAITKYPGESVVGIVIILSIGAILSLRKR